jgi:tripartite-type tricarboxylate transporter receptor subunit TctC
MMGSMGRVILVYMLLWPVGLAGGWHQERDYPDRPILLICPWALGGGTDTVSREVAMLLEMDLGVPVNVINAIGGAGVTGHTRGALARPDGYTLMMMTVEIHMLHHRGLTNISHEDFEPVALLNTDATAVFVPFDSDWQNLKQLEDAIRESPGQLSASGTVDGGIWHLGLAEWLLAVGLKPSDVNWIGMNGAEPSLQELTAGGLDFVCCSLPEGRSRLEAEQLRCLGVMAEKRLEKFPDVPTFRELGLDCATAGWRGIALPKGTPAAIVQELADALQRVVEEDQFRQFMAKAGFSITWQPPQEFAESLAEGDVRFGKILRSEAFQSIRRTSFGPYFFPKLLALLALVVGGGLLVTGNLKVDPEVAAISRRGLIRVAEVVAWVVLYLMIVERVGFVLTAAGLTLLMLVRLGTRWPAAVALSAVVVPVAYHLFAVVLRVPLPRGWLGW